MDKEELAQEHHFIQTGLSVGKAQSHAELTLEFAKQEAIDFAEWVGQNHLDITQGCPHLDDMPETLYSLYKSQVK